MKVINLNNLMIVIKIIINMKNSWSMISVNNNTKIIRMKKQMRKKIKKILLKWRYFAVHFMKTKF